MAFSFFQKNVSSSSLEAKKEKLSFTFPFPIRRMVTREKTEMRNKARVTLSDSALMRGFFPLSTLLSVFPEVITIGS